MEHKVGDKVKIAGNTNLDIPVGTEVIIEGIGDILFPYLVIEKSIGFVSWVKEYEIE